jgi:general stress protein YciG
MSDHPKQKRGFSGMSAEKQREIAAKGGAAVPAGKRSFKKNPDLAAAAGRKGGMSVQPEKRTFSTNPALAREAGRKGAYASAKSRKPEK